MLSFLQRWIELFLFMSKNVAYMKFIYSKFEWKQFLIKRSKSIKLYLTILETEKDHKMENISSIWIVNNLKKTTTF